MNIEDVKKLSPTERFLYWISEREEIRLKREANEPPPWTKDEILQAYRFCNVRRADDAVSLWLIRNWYIPYRDHPNMLLAVALARFVNKPSTLERIGFPARRWEPVRIKKVIRKIMDTEGHAWNPAYMVRGNDGKTKEESVVDFNVTPLRKNPPAIDTSSVRNTWVALASCYGFGSFMAGQVAADLTFALTGTWADKGIWAPLGPGSRRGLNRLLERSIDTPISQEHFEDYLTGIIDLCKFQLPALITDGLCAQDYQSCLCETDKYNRVLLGEGRPKQRYNGRG